MRKLSAFAWAAVLLFAILALAGCGGPEVPNVVGMNQADAVRALQDEGYLLGEVTAVATDTVPLGTIAGQVPAAGERAKDGTAVDLQVSFSDGQQVIVPTVTGLSQTTAEGVADTLRLTPVIVEQYSDDVVDGEVGGQVPEPGAQVTPGSNLVMVVSKGPEPEKSKVPDVTGKSQSDAEAALESAGFSVEVFSVYDSEVAKGKVMAQLPGAGESARTGSVVQIVVSLGAGTGSAKVPAVVGKTESSAVSAIESAGLKSQKVSQYDPSVAKGTVISQFPDSGSTAATGSEVLILVSKGAEPADTVAVPNVVGMALADATAALEAAGFTVTTQEVASEESAGGVFYQFPAAGTMAAPSSDVLVVVAAAP